MKILFILCFLLLSQATAQQVAELSNLVKAVGNNDYIIDADYVDVLTPKDAVAKKIILAANAKHYKAVLSNQNPVKRSLKITAKTSVALLTFPNLTLKTTTLENLRLALEFDETLPSEFEMYSPSYFYLTLSGTTITKIIQVNTRVLTGIHYQTVLISKQSQIKTGQFVLDFVSVYTTNREMQRLGKSMEEAPGGLYISNTNPQLRTFKFAQTGVVELFKDVQQYVNVSLKQLEDGFNGTWSGLGFSWDSYFNAVISDVTGEILELSQGYIP